MNLKLTANALCAVEQSVKKPFVDIIAELESEGGASLSTLRALLAAGIAVGRYPNMPFLHLDTDEAGRVLDERGIHAVATEVGKALRAYFDTVRAARG